MKLNVPTTKQNNDNNDNKKAEISEAEFIAVG